MQFVEKSSNCGNLNKVNHVGLIYISFTYFVRDLNNNKAK